MNKAKRGTHQIKHSIERMRDLVQSGMCKELIMEHMGIESPTVFNSVKLRLMETDGRFYKVMSKREFVESLKPVYINNQRSMIIPKATLCSCGFDVGDEFDININKNGITLSIKGTEATI